ncbi:MAG: prepilin-type N-terminal cleavage/methylation domain-containing protein [Lentisphaerae bacterium]|nr:prepilin-type N-terminal cleavage/methylation domain-containing protein [Lentisphaerota bacterium]
MRRHHRGRRGLTLIEVVLAVAILSVGLSFLLAAASKCIAVMKVSGKYQRAQWIRGRGELEFPLAEAEELDDMEVEPYEYDNGLSFSREVGDDDDEDGLYVVRTRVSWSEHGRESFEEVVRYVWHPEEDDN